eukprot:3882010-Rhodomonas_salina.6
MLRETALPCAGVRLAVGSRCHVFGPHAFVLLHDAIAILRLVLQYRACALVLPYRSVLCARYDLSGTDAAHADTRDAPFCPINNWEWWGYEVPYPATPVLRDVRD